MKTTFLLSLAAAAAFSFTACDRDDATSPADALVGEWALARTSGGIAGVDTTYAPDQPPAFVEITRAGTLSFRHGPDHAGIPGFTVPFTATLLEATDAGAVFALAFPDETLEGVARFRGVVAVRDDQLDFYDPDIADGFTETYVRAAGRQP